MARLKVAASHVEWLSLVETTGVFLTVPVVRRVFPNGLGATADDLRSELRLHLARAEQTQAWATTWTRWVLRDLLGLEQALLEGPAVPDRATHVVAEHGVLLRPEYAVADLEGGPEGRTLRMLVLAFPHGTARDRPLAGDRWAATPIERAFTLQRAAGVPLVMATDGDWFSVVASPAGGTATSATWVSSIFGEEPVLLDSFVALIGARRFFAVDTPNTLPSMLAESAQAQEEVTSRLGTQVRQAVELLVGALSRANRARKGELLADVSAETVYAAALTVMMRTVFLLYAEERDLLPAREALYADSYGVLGLREKLQAEADRFGDEALERRSAGWHQLLAAFRAIHGGIEHEALRLPAYGGGLFDPDRYPFLEGRRAEEPWRLHDSRPLPVDDRSVLAILDALQILTFRDGGVTEARRLSYRSLDVEQIGHVYEGLLDHGAVKVDELAVGLKGSGGDGPELALELIEETAAKGDAALRRFLVDRTGRSAAQIEKGLTLKPGPDLIGKLRSACEHDDGHVERVLPYVGLMEEDLRGMPTVFMPGSVYVTSTTERRDTGTQYTPKDLADEIVRYALEPLVYAPGPAEGAEPADWRIKRPDEILALRVCDPAVGSGAILVAACRFLSERLIESARVHVPEVGGTRRLSADDPDVALVARRLIVDHCLYGVDRNPLAAEMAKLSLWLVTLAKERPFTFLDHAVRVGDSLLGVTSLDQVRNLHLDPVRGRRQHRSLLAVTEAIDPLVDEALAWIQSMRDVDPVTVSDVEEQRAMSAEADRALERVTIIADAVVGKALAASRPGYASLDESLEVLAVEVRKALDPRQSEAERLAVWTSIRDDALYDLDTDRPPMTPQRRPLHWPLAFPEAFLRPGSGFDAIVGNPPFMGNKYWASRLGPALQPLWTQVFGHGLGKCDLVAVFFLRAYSLLAPAGCAGLLATSSIAEGETRRASLDRIETGSTIFRARSAREWPGTANVVVCQVWFARGAWRGLAFIDDQPVDHIGPSLVGSGLNDAHSPMRLNEIFAFEGSHNAKGGAFLLSPDEDNWKVLRSAECPYLRPYVTGEDVGSTPLKHPVRWALDCGGGSLEEVARQSPEAGAFLETVVRPKRDSATLRPYKGLERRWWQFWNPRVDQYARLRREPDCLVMPVVSKYVVVVRAPTWWTYTNKIFVVERTGPSLQAVLQSSVFEIWMRRMSGTLGLGLSLSLNDGLRTFPLPASEVADSERLVAQWEASCDAWFSLHGGGWTSLLNALNELGDPEAEAVRKARRDIDTAVLTAYGWNDLGSGATSLAGAVTEILDRLLELNHVRYAREQAELVTGIKPVRKRKGSAPGQTSMLGED